MLINANVDLCPCSFMQITLIYINIYINNALIYFNNADYLHLFLFLNEAVLSLC